MIIEINSKFYNPILMKLNEVVVYTTTTVDYFRKFPALENFPCWKFTRWKSVAGNAGKMEKF